MKEQRKRVTLSISGEANYRLRGNMSPPVTVVVREISKQGLRFVTSEALSPGTALELTVKITSISNPINAIGTVLWQRRLSSRFLLDTCITFTELNPESEHKIVDYILQFSECSIISREHVRCSLIGPVEYTVLSDGSSSRATSADIGVEGMKLFVDRMQDIDDVLALTFDLPDQKPTLSLKAKVVWQRQESNKMLGVQFIGLDPVARERIVDYISKTLVGEHEA